MQNNDEFNDTIKNLASSLDSESLESLISQLSGDKPKAQKKQPILSNELTKEAKEHEAKVIQQEEQNKSGVNNNENKEKETVQTQPKENKDKQKPNERKDVNKEKQDLKKEYKEKKEQMQEGLAVIEKEEKALKAKTDNFVETFTEKDPLEAMRLIASNPNYSEALLQYTDPKVSENQFKLFIIAQCKREIYKILKYSEYLDKLEARFEELYIDRINELSDGMIIRLMQLVVDKIDRGNELINSVIKDKDITNVLIINQQNNNVNNISELTRDKLLQTLYKASQDRAESPSASRAKVIETVTDIWKEASDEDVLESLEEQEENQPIEAEVINEQSSELEEIDKALAQLQKQKEGGNQ